MQIALYALQGKYIKKNDYTKSNIINYHQSHFYHLFLAPSLKSPLYVSTSRCSTKV